MRDVYRTARLLPVVVCAFLVGFVSLSGCSLNRIAAETTAGLMDQASQSFNEEPDPVLAREAMPANLKLMEGLLKVAPANTALLTTLARGWCCYGFGFLEDSGDRGDLDRASALYLRGFGLGIRAFSPGVAAALRDGSLADIERTLDSLGKGELPQLFWSAYCLGNWVQLNLSSVDGVAELSKVELMMRRVAALDPGYYHGGADLFYGLYYGKRPRLLGGDLVKAREHLLRAASFSGGRFLMAKLFLAEVYAVAVQDQKLFEDTLREIIAAPVDVMPGEQLANALARGRAVRLLARKSELFEEPAAPATGAADPPATGAADPLAAGTADPLAAGTADPPAEKGEP